MRRLASARGQTLYVPVSSTMYVNNDWSEGSLAVTLSIRNTDRDHGITVQRLDYHDSNGKRIEPVTEEAIELAALGSRRFLVTSEDRRGGPGALFIMEWTSNEAVTEPIVEAVNVFASGSRSFAFVTHARVLESHTDPP